MRKLWKKIVVLILIFVATVAGMAALVLLGKDENRQISASYETMGEAVLPVVYMEFEGREINRMHGYTVPMKGQYMKDTTTPLPEDRRLKVLIDRYGSEVVNISYEIRSLDTKRLVESTQLTSWDTQEDRITAVLPIQNLLEEDTEYLLTLIVSTRDSGNVYYYGNIVYSDSLHTAEMIDFVTDFSLKTLDKEAAKSLAVYMKNSTEDKDTLGDVSLRTSYSQIVWGKLSPSRITEPVISVKDISSSIGTIRLNYRVKAADEDGTVRTYDVEETYCLQKSQSQWYLLTFNRSMDQLLEPDTITSSGGYIDLGILSSGSVKVDGTGSESWQRFVLNGELWGYQGSTGDLTRIFSFRDENDDGVRTDYRQHDIQMVGSDDKGNMDFIVYGYMNRGSHEGEVGLVFYRYHSEENALEEVFYLPYQKPYSIMKEELGTLSYISETGLLYLMLNNSIYAIDFVGNECLVVVDYVNEESLVISDDRSVIAWQEGENPYAASSVQVMYLDSGKKQTVTAGEGEYLKALGFCGDDFICGYARQSDVPADVENAGTFPMYKLEIINEDGGIETDYEIGGVYVTGVSIEPGSIRLMRAVKTGEGFAATDEDALIMNESVPQNAVYGLETKDTSWKKRVYLLKVNGTAGENGIQQKAPSRIILENSNLLAFADSGKEDQAYYAYSKGDLQAICRTAAEAVNMVYDDIGLVLDGSGNYVMRRGFKGSGASVSVSTTSTAADESSRLATCVDVMLKYENISVDVKGLLAESRTPLEILTQSLPGRTYDLTGCDLTAVVYYFLSQGRPLLAMTEGTGAYLIVGYDNSNVYLFDPMQGKSISMKATEAEEMFRLSGNRFLGYSG